MTIPRESLSDPRNREDIFTNTIRAPENSGYSQEICAWPDIYAAGPSSSTLSCPVRYASHALPSESRGTNEVHGESTDESTPSCNVQSHFDERAHPCQYCHKRFNHISNLRRHMLLHTGNSRYLCEICGKLCFELCVLKAHMRVHTGESPFACKICGKEFKQKNHMNTHRRVHSGTKPFSCSICNRGFGQSGNLKRHMLVHTPSEPFTCPICGKTFRKGQRVKTHMKTHIEIGASCREESETDHQDKQFLDCRVNGFNPPSETESNGLRRQDVSDILARAILGHRSEDSCDEETREMIKYIIEDINKSYQEKHGI
ncbi:hypothetical protein QAD02_019564 [Eretmocerus hayati]|uniref:Uncharacterized protein n=1 Tax=Eretmocerus hayati TaxID=131215 RepID=A0ACC2PN44_9HYME|nr:hypothetical protein QAD02_019564 [Eretmocerus hayati]